MAVEDELAALRSVAEALEQLDHNECCRVVQWAEARYVKRVSTHSLEGFNKLLTSLNEAATRMDISPSAIIRTYERIVSETSEEPQDLARP